MVYKLEKKLSKRAIESVMMAQIVEGMLSDRTSIAREKSFCLDDIYQLIHPYLKLLRCLHNYDIELPEDSGVSSFGCGICFELGVSIRDVIDEGNEKYLQNKSFMLHLITGVVAEYFHIDKEDIVNVIC